VIANSRSLADVVLSFDVEGDDGTSLEKAWAPPTSTPPEIRLFRKNFAAEVEGGLPECDSDDDSDDDDPLATAAAAAEGSKPFLDLS
jgi:hypothetical protein